MCKRLGNEHMQANSNEEEVSHGRVRESSGVLTLMALRTCFMVTVGKVFVLQLQKAEFSS